jgi:hypothetical protein
MREENWSELGKAMDALAKESAGVSGPYNVGKYVWEKTGRGPGLDKRGRGSSAWSQIYRGETECSHETMRAFVEAFELTREQRAPLLEVWFRGGQLPGLAAA